MPHNAQAIRYHLHPCYMHLLAIANMDACGFSNIEIPFSVLFSFVRNTFQPAQQSCVAACASLSPYVFVDDNIALHLLE